MAPKWATEGKLLAQSTSTFLSPLCVSRWDPSQEDWEEMAPLYQARCFFPLVALDGLLYALGGRDNGVALNSVETYNPELNVWR